MAIIKVKKIPRKQEKPEDLLATFCFYYPQYKYHEARQLPYRRINKMLKVARKETARNYKMMLDIAIAPHTKNPSSTVKQIQGRLTDIIKE